MLHARAVAVLVITVAALPHASASAAASSSAGAAASAGSAAAAAIPPPVGGGRPLTCTSAPFTSLPFCNASLPTSARVADAVSRMPLSEKLYSMYRQFGSPFVACGGAGGAPSLGIDALPRTSECVHGVSAGCTEVAGVRRCPTLFANGGAMGASFNRSLWRAIGGVIGDELRALANLGGGPSGFSCWSPQLNLARDPRWGRAQEVVGEDPYLASEFGVAYVRGMTEGEDARYIKIASSPKHFLAYNSEGLGPNNETGLCTADKGTWPGAVPYPDGGPGGNHTCRYSYDQNLTARDLVEYYLPAWHAVTTRAHISGVMCSYTATNGVPSCASHWALTELLRDTWGMSGYVVSDCLALQVMMQAHHYLPYDIPLAAATAINAGVDWNCGCVIGACCCCAAGPAHRLAALPGLALTSCAPRRARLLPSPAPTANGTSAALARGLLNESAIDESVSRVLRVLFELGEFDAEVPYRSYGAERLDTPAHRALAQASAAQGLVLLRNAHGALPLARGAKLAFIGPSADDGGIMQSSYGGDCDLCANHTPLRAARAAGLAVTYTRGCDVVSEDTSGFAAAAAAAAAADVAVLFLGFDFPWESEWGNGPDCQNDRPHLRLPGVQEGLIAAVAATGKPLVVVLMNGGAVAVEAWLPSVDALVEAWYPGELGGDAIVAALLGDANRFGALPVTMYADTFSARDLYSSEAAQLAYDGGVTHGYYTNTYGPPTFRFGFQGSYTTFAVTWADGAPPPAAARVSAAAAAAPLAPLIAYRCNVTNTGTVAGDAVILLLVAGTPPDYPLERLINFDRVTLAPGETATISFVATAHDLSAVRADGTRWLQPGTALAITLGGRDGGAAGAPLHHALSLVGPAAVQLPVFPAPPGREHAYTLRRAQTEGGERPRG